MNEIDDIFSCMKSKKTNIINSAPTTEPERQIGKKVGKKVGKRLGHEEMNEFIDKENELKGEGEGEGEGEGGGGGGGEGEIKDGNETERKRKETKDELVQIVTHSNDIKKSLDFKKISDQDDDGFFDSRGTNSKRKKTEEGFNIYHEDELKIGLGGDTENCPFDCTCCY